MKKIYKLLITFLFLFILVGCKNNEKDKFEYTYKNGDEEVKCNYNPKNVAVLYPSYSSIWLNSGGKIEIGVEDTINRGFAENIKIVGSGTGKNIDLEKLISYNPDFTVLSVDFPNHIELANELSNLNMPYGIFKLEDFDDYLNILDIFSQINKNDLSYKKYGLDIKDEIDSVLNIANNNEKQDILLIRASSTKLQAKSSDYFVGAMLKELNTFNICDTNSNMVDTISLEYIIKKQPKYIFVTTMGNEENAIKYLNSEFKNDTWQAVNAVKENNYYVLPHDLFQYKPNERWAEAIEYLAKILYKDEFKN